MANHFGNAPWPGSDGTGQVKMFNSGQFSGPPQTGVTNQPMATTHNTAANGYDRNMWSSPGDGQWSGGPQQPVATEPVGYSTLPGNAVNAFTDGNMPQQPWSPGHSQPATNGPLTGSQFDANAFHQPPPAGNPYGGAGQPWNQGQQPYPGASGMHPPDNSQGPVGGGEGQSPGMGMASLGNRMEEVNLNEYGGAPRADPTNILPASNSFSNLQHQPSPFDALGSPPSLQPPQPGIQDHGTMATATSGSLFQASTHSRHSSVGGPGGVQFIVGSNSSSTSPSASHSPASQPLDPPQGPGYIGSPPEQGGPGGDQCSPERPASVSSSTSYREVGRPPSVQSSASAEVASLMQQPAVQPPQPIPEMQPGVDPSGLMMGGPPPPTRSTAGEGPPLQSPPIGSQFTSSPPSAPQQMGAPSPAGGNPFRKGPTRSPYTPPQASSQSTGTGSSAQGFHPSPVTAPHFAGPINVQAHTEIGPSVAEAPNLSPQMMSNMHPSSPESSLASPQDVPPLGDGGSGTSHNLDIYASPIEPHPQGPFKPPTPREEVSLMHDQHESALFNPQSMGQSHVSDNMGHSHGNVVDNTGAIQESDNRGGPKILGSAKMSDNREISQPGASDNREISQTGVSDNRDTLDTRGVVPTPSVQTPEEYKSSPFYQQQKDSEKKQGTFSPPLTLWETPVQGHPGGVQLAPVAGQSESWTGVQSAQVLQNPALPQGVKTGAEGRTMPGIVPLGQADVPQNSGIAGSPPQPLPLQVQMPPAGNPTLSPPVTNPLGQQEVHGAGELGPLRPLNAEGGGIQFSPQSSVSGVQSLTTPAHKTDHQTMSGMQDASHGLPPTTNQQGAFETQSAPTLSNQQTPGAMQGSQQNMPDPGPPQNPVTHPLPPQSQGLVPGSTSQPQSSVPGLQNPSAHQLHGSVSETMPAQVASHIPEQVHGSVHQPISAPPNNQPTGQMQGGESHRPGLFQGHVPSQLNQLPGHMQEAPGQVVPGHLTSQSTEQTQGSINPVPGYSAGAPSSGHFNPDVPPTSGAFSVHAQPQGHTANSPRSLQGHQEAAPQNPVMNTGQSISESGGESYPGFPGHHPASQQQPPAMLGLQQQAPINPATQIPAAGETVTSGVVGTNPVTDPHHHHHQLPHQPQAISNNPANPGQNTHPPPSSSQQVSSNPDHGAHTTSHNKEYLPQPANPHIPPHSQPPTATPEQIQNPPAIPQTTNPPLSAANTVAQPIESRQEVQQEVKPRQPASESHGYRGDAQEVSAESHHRRNESHDSLINEYNKNRSTTQDPQYSSNQRPDQYPSGQSQDQYSSHQKPDQYSANKQPDQYPPGPSQDQYSSSQRRDQYTSRENQDQYSGLGKDQYPSKDKPDQYRQNPDEYSSSKQADNYSRGDREQRGSSRDDYYRREHDRRYDNRSYDYYGRQNSSSYDPYGDQRYDPRYDMYRDADYDQRYNPHRPSSRSGREEGYEAGERSRARARPDQTDPRYRRDGSRHGRDDRAHSLSRSRYEGEERPHSRQGQQHHDNRPRSRQGYEEYDYSRDPRYDQYYGRGHYEGYDDRYQRDRYQRGYESEMQNYQGQQYYDQYAAAHQYTQQQKDYYARHGYYQQQHSLDHSSHGDNHSVHSRGSTPGFDHPAYTSNSGAEHFAREFHQGSRPSSRASATYEQSPIYHAQDATSRHGYYEQSYDQSYTGYDQYHSGQPVIETEPARRTPHKHTMPHVRASFAPNGHMVKVLANQPQEGQPAIVEITEASGVYEAVHAEELKVFPGPLVKGETHKNDVLRFCQNKVRELDNNVGMIDRESAQLLWRYLELLIKQNGTVVGTDLADLLMDGHEQSTQNLPLSGSTVTTEMDFSHGDVNVTSDRSLVSADVKTTALDRFRQLCLFGRKKEALEFAMKVGLWEQALFLAQRMGPRISASVYTRFMNSALSVNDPLRTMYQLMSGRQPAACTMVGEERFGDWRPHLAIVLSHPSDKPDIHHKSIVSMGDSFASRGYLYASQICYLLAGCTFQDFSKKTAKLVLLGANHSQSLDEFATNSCIQCTEIYEYATSLAKPVFSLPTLQVFKYLYTTRLLDAGMMEEALHYCEVLASTLSQNPTLYSQTLVEQVADLGDRIKGHDPQRSQTDQELPDPAWLIGIQAIVQQYQSGLIQTVAPSSGSHTPADTRSSSEVAEILSSANQIAGVQEGYTQPQPGTDTQGYTQGYSMDPQVAQATHQQPPQQAWDATQQNVMATQQNAMATQQNAMATQPATGEASVGQAATNQPLELWNASTGTWTYADPSATYQQPQEAGVQQDMTQWGQVYQTGTYTQDYQQPGAETQATQPEVNQSYQNPTEPQQPMMQYGGQEMTDRQEVLPSVPEHHDAEGGEQAFDYYGQQAGTTALYSQAATNHSLPNGRLRIKSSDSSDSASDSETDSSDSASTVNDTTQSMLPRQQAPPTLSNHIHPPPPTTGYSGYTGYTGYQGSFPQTSSATWQRPQQPLPDIPEISPTETLTPTGSPRQPGIFQFGVPPPSSLVYRASDPSTPLGATQEVESTEEADGKGKKKTYWPGEDEAENDKLMQAAKKTDPKAADKAKSGGEGIFSRIFGIGKKNKNEMKLPDDKKKSIVWDEAKKAWVDTTSDGDSGTQVSAAPPPKDTDFARKMSMPATMSSIGGTGSSAVTGNDGPMATAPAGPNKFSRGKMGRGARSQYVDVLKGKAKPATTAPPNLFNVLPKSQSVPANIFIPSVADAAIDHHSHQPAQPDNTQTDTQTNSQTTQNPTDTDQDNLSRSSSQSSLATEVQYYLQQPQQPPQAVNNADTSQNYYHQNYDYSQSQNSFHNQAPPTQDISQSQQLPQSFGQSQSAFKQPAAPQKTSDQSELAPQFFNPASVNAKPQMGGASRLSRYGAQGGRRPQYPKQ